MFTEDQLSQLSTLIAERTGLNTFDRGRGRLMEIIHRRPEATSNFNGYITHLQMLDESHPIWQALIAELTVGETYFMRDSGQIEALRLHVLPVLLQEKRQKHNLSLRIWSAGCATGEEPYTLAILVDELVPDRGQWDIQILGTDLNEAAIEVAQAARYRDWSFRSTPHEIRQHYFTPLERTNPPIYEVRPEIRQAVRFQYGNLVQGMRQQFDLVLCRNVLLYFTRQQAEMVEAQLAKAVRKGGWLLLSPVETLRTTRPQYQTHQFDNTLLYHKQGSSTSIQPPSLPKTNIAAGEILTASVSLNDNIEAGYRRAVRALQSGQLNEALELTGQLLATNRPDVYSLMASILIRSGQTAKAYDYLTQALNMDTLYPEAHYLMGLIHMLENKLVPARIAVRAAIYCRPDFALAHLLSGDLFVHEGELSRASRAWSTARRFASELPSDVYVSDVTDVKAGQLIYSADKRLLSIHA